MLRYFKKAFEFNNDLIIKTCKQFIHGYPISTELSHKTIMCQFKEIIFEQIQDLSDIDDYLIKYNK
jgi:hypothetical protein